MKDKNVKTKIILLPGLDGTGKLFYPFTKECPSSFLPVVIKYPENEVLSYGHLEEIVMSKLPTGEKYLLLGESFSGPIAVKIASTNPKDLIGVILSASFIKSPVPSPLKMLPLGLFARLRPPLFMLRHWLTGDGNHPELLGILDNSVSNVSPVVMANRVYSILNVDVSAFLSKIKAPLLYLRAKEDRLVCMDCLDEIKKVKSDLCLAEIDAPHLLLQTRPVEAWRAITDFTENLQS